MYPADFYTGKKITRTIVRQYPGRPVRDSGFGVRASGFRVRGSGYMYIYPYLYTYYPHWFSSILAKISRINWDFVGFFACDSINFLI